MAVQTHLLQFHIQTIDQVDESSSHEKRFSEAEEIFLNGLKDDIEYFNSVSLIRVFTDKISLSLFQGPQNTIITVRFYALVNLVTVTIEYYLENGKKPIINYEESKKLEKKWSKLTGRNQTVKTLPSVIRGQSHDIYFITTDGRLLEYDFDVALFDEYSEYQHVQIFHSNAYGNVLVLDDDQNLAESDSIYNEKMMRKGIEVYKNSEILILGGGDGALLWTLLQENPKKVIMIEIDETVTRACKKYLRSLCGTALDTSVGVNYEIITGDCFPVMRKLLESGVKFDYIFGDLTTIPIVTNPEENASVQEFVLDVIKISYELLSVNGKYFTHGPTISGSSDQLEYILESQAELQAKKLQSKFKISKTSAFVPSFCEKWAFYAVHFLAIQNGK